MAIFLCAAFVAQDALAFAPAELRVEAARPMPEIRFTLPGSVGMIDDGFRGASVRPRVILFQDAHTNPSGQLNLSAALESVLRSEGARRVVVEGGWGDVNLAHLKSKPLAGSVDSSAIESIARSFVQKGLLHGEEYLQLTSDLVFDLSGVEDRALYEKSLRAYARTVRERTAALRYLDRVRRGLLDQQRFVFNPALTEFERSRARHRSGEMSITEYFETVRAAAKRQGVFLGAYPHLRLLARLAEMEKRIRFDRVAEEEQKALKTLSVEGRGELKAADAAHVPKRFGASGEEIARAHFLLLAEKIGNLRSYPNLAQYVEYLKTSHKLSAQSALEELDALEAETIDRLAPLPAEKTLLRLEDSARLLEKLIRLQITPTEYKKLNRNRPFSEAGALTGFVNGRIVRRQAGYDGALALDRVLRRAEASARRFYALAADRDRVFIRAIQKVLVAPNPAGSAGLADPTAPIVLITGGYHTPNLKASLKQQNISFVSILPQVREETDTARYERLLLVQLRHRERGEAARRTSRTPLESNLPENPSVKLPQPAATTLRTLMTANDPSAASRLAAALNSTPRASEPATATVMLIKPSPASAARMAGSDETPQPLEKLPAPQHAQSFSIEGYEIGSVRRVLSRLKALTVAVGATSNGLYDVRRLGNTEFFEIRAIPERIPRGHGNGKKLGMAEVITDDDGNILAVEYSKESDLSGQEEAACDQIRQWFEHQRSQKRPLAGSSVPDWLKENPSKGRNAMLKTGLIFNLIQILKESGWVREGDEFPHYTVDQPFGVGSSVYLVGQVRDPAAPADGIDDIQFKLHGIQSLLISSNLDPFGLSPSRPVRSNFSFISNLFPWGITYFKNAAGKTDIRSVPNDRVNSEGLSDLAVDDQGYIYVVVTRPWWNEFTKQDPELAQAKFYAGGYWLISEDAAELTNLRRASQYSVGGTSKNIPTTLTDVTPAAPTAARMAERPLDIPRLIRFDERSLAVMSDRSVPYIDHPTSGLLMDQSNGSLVSSKRHELSASQSWEYRDVGPYPVVEAALYRRIGAVDSGLLWFDDRFIPIVDDVIYHKDGSIMTAEELAGAGLELVRSGGLPVTVRMVATGGRVLAVPGPWPVPFVREGTVIRIIRTLDELSAIAGHKLNHADVQVALTELRAKGLIEVKIAGAMEFKGVGTAVFKPRSTESLIGFDSTGAGSLAGLPVYMPGGDIRGLTSMRGISGGVGAIEETEARALEQDRLLRSNGAELLADTVWFCELFTAERLTALENARTPSAWASMRMTYDTPRLSDFVHNYHDASPGVHPGFMLARYREIMGSQFTPDAAVRRLATNAARNYRALMLGRLSRSYASDVPDNYGSFLELIDTGTESLNPMPADRVAAVTLSWGGLQVYALERMVGILAADNIRDGEVFGWLAARPDFDSIYLKPLLIDDRLVGAAAEDFKRQKEVNLEAFVSLSAKYLKKSIAANTAARMAGSGQLVSGDTADPRTGLFTDAFTMVYGAKRQKITTAAKVGIDAVCYRFEGGSLVRSPDPDHPKDRDKFNVPDIYQNDAGRLVIPVGMFQTTVVELSDRQDVEMASWGHYDCASFSFRAKMDDRVVLGHSHISEHGDDDVYKEYQALIRFIKDHSDWTNVEIFFGVARRARGGLEGFPADIKIDDLRDEAQKAGFKWHEPWVKLNHDEGMDVILSRDRILSRVHEDFGEVASFEAMMGEPDTRLKYTYRDEPWSTGARMAGSESGRFYAGSRINPDSVRRLSPRRFSMRVSVMSFWNARINASAYGGWIRIMRASAGDLKQRISKSLSSVRMIRSSSLAILRIAKSGVDAGWAVISWPSEMTKRLNLEGMFSSTRKRMEAVRLLQKDSGFGSSRTRRQNAGRPARDPKSVGDNNLLRRSPRISRPLPEVPRRYTREPASRENKVFRGKFGDPRTNTSESLSRPFDSPKTKYNMDQKGLQSQGEAAARMATWGETPRPVAESPALMQDQALSIESFTISSVGQNPGRLLALTVAVGGVSNGMYEIRRMPSQSFFQITVVPTEKRRGSRPDKKLGGVGVTFAPDGTITAANYRMEPGLTQPEAAACDQIGKWFEHQRSQGRPLTGLSVRDWLKENPPQSRNAMLKTGLMYNLVRILSDGGWLRDKGRFPRYAVQSPGVGNIHLTGRMHDPVVEAKGFDEADFHLHGIQSLIISSNGKRPAFAGKGRRASGELDFILNTPPQGAVYLREPGKGKQLTIYEVSDDRADADGLSDLAVDDKGYIYVVVTRRLWDELTQRKPGLSQAQLYAGGYWIVSDDNATELAHLRRASQYSEGGTPGDGLNVLGDFNPAAPAGARMALSSADRTSFEPIDQWNKNNEVSRAAQDIFDLGYSRNVMGWSTEERKGVEVVGVDRVRREVVVRLKLGGAQYILNAEGAMWRWESTSKVVSLMNTKHGIRELLSGGPIRQPGYFAAIRRETGGLLQPTVLKDNSADPLFGNHTAVAFNTIISDFLEGKLRDDLGAKSSLNRLVIKPNVAANSNLVMLVDRLAGGAVRVRVHCDGERSKQFIRRLDNALSRYNKNVKKSQNQDFDLVSYRLQGPPKVIERMLKSMWEAMAWNDVHYDSGIAEAAIPFITPHGRAYEGRYPFTLKASGNFIPSRGFGRLGFSDGFTNDTDLHHDMHRPLADYFGWNADDLGAFERYVETILREEGIYARKRLIEFGILESNEDIFAKLDIMWIMPLPGGNGLPIPVILEAELFPSKKADSPPVCRIPINASVAGARMAEAGRVVSGVVVDGVEARRGHGARGVSRRQSVEVFAAQAAKGLAVGVGKKYVILWNDDPAGKRTEITVIRVSEKEVRFAIDGAAPRVEGMQAIFKRSGVSGFARQSVTTSLKMLEIMRSAIERIHGLKRQIGLDFELGSWDGLFGQGMTADQKTAHARLMIEQMKLFARAHQNARFIFPSIDKKLLPREAAQAVEAAVRQNSAVMSFAKKSGPGIGAVTKPAGPNRLKVYLWTRPTKRTGAANLLLPKLTADAVPLWLNYFTTAAAGVEALLPADASADPGRAFGNAEGFADADLAGQALKTSYSPQQFTNIGKLNGFRLRLQGKVTFGRKLRPRMLQVDIARFLQVLQATIQQTEVMA